MTSEWPRCTLFNIFDIGVCKRAYRSGSLDTLVLKRRRADVCVGRLANGVCDENIRIAWGGRNGFKSE